MLKLFSRQKEAVVKPEPVAIIDIGSNSVRLVAYQGLARAPTPIFNEKVMCGLGKGVVTTGRLPEEGVEKALRALLRYRALCETMGVDDIQVVATAAARDADNGPAFLEAARRAIRREIMLLSGGREAELSALGVVSSIHQADGVVGDLGGGDIADSLLQGSSVELDLTILGLRSQRSQTTG